MSMLQPVNAPYVRPGVVVHEPGAAVHDLLGLFALTLRQRGFAVRGCVRRDGQLFDLDAARPLTGAAEPLRFAADAFRRAMRDNSDLVVVGGFPAFAAAARELAAIPGPSRGMPVLTAIPGGDIQQWLDFAGQAGTMVSPDMKSLWQWWGAERLYQDLALGVAEDEVRQIVCGPRWVMVQGASGTGLCHLPHNSKAMLPRLAAYRKAGLRGLATLASSSWDPLEMALAIAAINAHYNRVDHVDEAGGRLGTGAETLGGEAGRVVVIGAFPGLAEILPHPQVIESQPRPGEYPTAAMDTLLPGCAAAVVASSTLLNRSLPRILRLAQGSRIVLSGPMAPLTPRLHLYGVEAVGGLVVRDVAGLAEAVRAGAMPREFHRFGQYRHIRHERPAVAPKCRFRAVAAAS